MELGKHPCFFSACFHLKVARKSSVTKPKITSSLMFHLFTQLRAETHINMIPKVCSVFYRQNIKKYSSSKEVGVVSQKVLDLCAVLLVFVQKLLLDLVVVLGCLNLRNIFISVVSFSREPNVRSALRDHVSFQLTTSWVPPADIWPIRCSHKAVTFALRNLLEKAHFLTEDRNLTVYSKWELLWFSSLISMFFSLGCSTLKSL